MPDQLKKRRYFGASISSAVWVGTLNKWIKPSVQKYSKFEKNLWICSDFGYVIRSMEVWSISFVVLECFIHSQAAFSYAVVFLSDPKPPWEVCFQTIWQQHEQPHTLWVFWLLHRVMGHHRAPSANTPLQSAEAFLEHRPMLPRELTKPSHRWRFSAFSSLQWVKSHHLSSREWEKKLVTKEMFHIKKDSSFEMAPNLQGWRLCPICGKQGDYYFNIPWTKFYEKFM